MHHDEHLESTILEKIQTISTIPGAFNTFFRVKIQSDLYITTHSEMSCTH